MKTKDWVSFWRKLKEEGEFASTSVDSNILQSGNVAGKPEHLELSKGFQKDKEESDEQG